ncbi:hypothetical protein [Sphingobium ummariense]
MAALTGAAAAIVVLAMPVGLVELVVASSGLSEALPAAAPPLGLKARLILSGFAALMAAGLVDVMRRSQRDTARQEENQGRRSSPPGARKMGFALSKLTSLARGRSTASPEGQPSLRRADAHPDAPPRPPIFASRDFDGVDIFPRAEPSRRRLVVNGESEQQLRVSTLATPAALAPQPVEEMPQPSFAQPAGSSFVAATEMVSAAQPSFTHPVAQEQGERVADLALPPVSPELSLSELTARLERSLARHAQPGGSPRVIADMPIVPPVPVREAVSPDVDDALQAALGALRSMTGRTR